VSGGTNPVFIGSSVTDQRTLGGIINTVGTINGSNSNASYTISQRSGTTGLALTGADSSSPAALTLISGNHWIDAPILLDAGHSSDPFSGQAQARQSNDPSGRGNDAGRVRRRPKTRSQETGDSLGPRLPWARKKIG